MRLVLQLMVGFFFVFSVSVHAQIQVSGMVQDALTGKALVGATVSNLEGTDGTETNEEGTFSISTLQDTLIVRYVGYQSAFLTPILS